MQKIFFLHQKFLVLNVRHIHHAMWGASSKDGIVFPRDFWVYQIPEIVLILVNKKIVCSRFLSKQSSERFDFTHWRCFLSDLWLKRWNNLLVIVHLLLLFFYITVSKGILKALNLVHDRLSSAFFLLLFNNLRNLELIDWNCIVLLHAFFRGSLTSPISLQNWLVNDS